MRTPVKLLAAVIDRLWPVSFARREEEAAYLDGEPILKDYICVGHAEEV